MRFLDRIISAKNYDVIPRDNAYIYDCLIVGERGMAINMLRQLYGMSLYEARNHVYLVEKRKVEIAVN
jgi:hypothetical protein